jgi:carbamoyltransferase|tara:strand:+ start:13989 stop:15809 length:1821 start_codon:yes stop_codon:yes gene_type:complete
MKKDIWIAGITRGHNGSVCLLKNGEIVFAIEEERISRFKYDGTPLATMVKILEYTDKLDYIVLAHTTPDTSSVTADYTGENIYTAMARKLGLIKTPKYEEDTRNHQQVIDLSRMHHKLHAACAFYRSGFDEAVALIVDGAGTFYNMEVGLSEPFEGWETESIYACSYPNKIQTLYKHLATRNSMITRRIHDFSAEEYFSDDPGTICEVTLSDVAGIVKTYEAVTQYCGWHSIEAGKTMGLFPYGAPTDKIPKLFNEDTGLSNRSLVIPCYPRGADVNFGAYDYLMYHGKEPHETQDFTLLENRRNLAYALQTQTQDQVTTLIKKSVEMSGCKNVVISGGYGLNCVANYHYLEALKDEGINIFVEPISSDAGTAIGAALLIWHDWTGRERVDYTKAGLYLGFDHSYSDSDINTVAQKYTSTVTDATHADVIELMTNKNIVACFQGKSESGPRALGNRSLMFDPTFKDGKDFVNEIKHREYFRPFAGSILAEDVHEWFDLRGMEDSPYMMYAVNCKPGIAEKIPAIIHVDGTCRIQTVTREQNPHYYDIIKAFKEKTGCPIIFNTSFNLGGEPLVETLDDAIRTLSDSEIEYLYLPEYNKLITVKNII